MKPHTFCVVGRAGAGKTLFLERLVPHLVKAGVTVATFKASTRPCKLDYPASDVARMARAGAVRSVLLHPDGVLVFPGGEADLSRALEMARADCDVLLVEGRIQGGYPVIEVVRAGLPVFEADEIWMSITERSLGRDREVPDAEQAAREILKQLGSSVVTA